MKTLKLIAIGVVIFFLGILNTNAQSDSDINAQIWSVLHKIQVPASHLSDREPFFWELSSHTTKDSFYSPMSTDTTSTYNFWALYFEMVNSAYVSGTLPDQGTVMNEAVLASGHDTIPIGMLDCGYNTLVNDAFTTNGVYLNWNNDSVWPIPDVNPFAFNPATSNYRWIMFTAAPMNCSSNFKNVTFSVNPTFIFNGPTYNDDPILTSDVVQINFGDGSGWHTVPNLTTTTYYSVDYPYRGTYYIQTSVTRDGTPIRYSESTFVVEQNLTLKVPDEYITSVAGLTVGVYLGCGHDSIVKPLIYLKGIDPLETRHVPEIYAEMINEPGLVMLRNYDYDIIIVEWNNSRIDMTVNAESVEGLLQYLTTKVHDTTQFVVVGESMGGVIGRFALTAMETSDYINGIVGEFPPHPKSHNTRLFITIDAPQQGAIVPLAAQAAVDYIYHMPSVLARLCFAVYDLVNNGDYLWNNVLSQEAVKQLLIYHDQARTLSGTYPPLSDHTDFYNTLYSMNPSSNGYPVHCKTMALSNGLMDGKGQVGFHDSLVGPGSKYMDMNLAVGVRFLRIFYIEEWSLPTYKLYAEPNGSGTIINLSHTFKFPTLVGCLVAFFTGNPLAIIPCMNSVPYSLSETANDVLPLETGSGGYYPSVGAAIANPSAYGLPREYHRVDWWVFKSQYRIDSTTGSLSYNMQIGILDPLAISFSISTEIINFCFIPYYSSLDYTPPGGIPLNEDILHDPVSLTMPRTNYDVIVGIVTDTILPPTYPNFEYIDQGTQPSEHLNERADGVSGYDHATYLNREIGDFAMNLDNLEINRQAMFQATQTIYAGNEESLYYQYVDFGPTFSLGGGGMFSKNNDFIDDASGGDVEFKAGKEIRLEPGFEAQNGCTFWAHIVAQDTCSLSYGGFQSVGPPEKQEFWPAANNNNISTIPSNSDTIPKKFSVYPNPSQSLFYVSMPPTPQTNATLFDAFGEEIAIFDVSNQKQFVIDPGKYDLANGMYFLVVNTKNKTYTEKLVINH